MLVVARASINGVGISAYPAQQIAFTLDASYVSVLAESSGYAYATGEYTIALGEKSRIVAYYNRLELFYFGATFTL